MNLLATPVTVQGTLTTEGTETAGDVIVDMTVDTSVTPLAYGGTVTIAGEVYDVAELVEDEEG
jgi:hypothetical protein